MSNEIRTTPRFVSRLTRDTLALILAGGRGSRLKMLTDWRAKPAVPFGGKFRIIDFALSNCLNSGIRRISVLTQYTSGLAGFRMHGGAAVGQAADQRPMNVAQLGTSSHPAGIFGGLARPDQLDENLPGQRNFSLV